MTEEQKDVTVPATEEGVTHDAHATHDDHAEPEVKPEDHASEPEGEEAA